MTADPTIPEPAGPSVAERVRRAINQYPWRTTAAVDKQILCEVLAALVPAREPGEPSRDELLDAIYTLLMDEEADHHERGEAAAYLTGAVEDRVPVEDDTRSEFLVTARFLTPEEVAEGQRLVADADADCGTEAEQAATSWLIRKARPLLAAAEALPALEAEREQLRVLIVGEAAHDPNCNIDIADCDCWHRVALDLLSVQDEEPTREGAGG